MAVTDDEYDSHLNHEVGIQDRGREPMRSLVPDVIQNSATTGCKLNTVEAMIVAVVEKHRSDFLQLAPDHTIDFAAAADAVLVFAYALDESFQPLLDHIGSCDFCAPAFAALVEAHLMEIGFVVSSEPIPSQRLDTSNTLLQSLRDASADLTRQGSRCAVLWIEEHLDEIEEAMDRADLVGDDSLVVAYGRALHRYYWWRGKMDGMTYLKRAVDAAHRLQDLGSLAYLLWAQADLVRRRCDYKQALDLYDQAEAIHKEIDNSMGLADCLKGRAEVFRRMDEYDQALRIYDQALHLYDASGDRMGVANCIRGKADTYRRMDQLNLAINAFEDAKWRYEELGVLLGVANCMKGKAEIYRTKGLSSYALNYFEDAKKLYEQLDAQMGVAHCLRGTGDVYWMRCQYEEAVDSYHQATQIYVSVGLHRPGIARTYLGWAETYSQTDDFIAARDCLVKALKEYRHVHSRLGRARCLCAKATILRKERPNDHQTLNKATRLYERALGIFREIGSQRGIADCLRGMAATQRYQQKYEEALALYEQAVRHYEDIDASLGMAYCLRGMGKTFMATEQYEEAERVFEQEAEIFVQFEGREAEVATAHQQQAAARDRIKKTIAQKRLLEIHAHQPNPYL
jgi:tetratricopeptide (TPR) repeat protein